MVAPRKMGEGGREGGDKFVLVKLDFEWGTNPYRDGASRKAFKWGNFITSPEKK